MLSKKVLYVPLTYSGDSVGFRTWKDMRYYDWQDRLFGFFLEHDRWDVTWKGLPRSCHVEDPWQYKCKRNVKYSSASLVSELKKAEYVYLDFASTPLLDCVKAGSNFLCTIFEGQKYLRPNVPGVVVAKDASDALGLLFDFVAANIKPSIDEIVLNKVDWKKEIL